MQVAAIVPAFNEDKTIDKVLNVLVRVPQVQEVIVVNDGSTDKTSQVARTVPGVKVIDLPKNKGKGFAMVEGARNTTADVLVFIDADLVGLTPDHVLRLVEPVLSGEADMTVGVFTKGRLATDLAQRITPFLSGQRAMVRSIIDNAANLETAGYGAEVAISRYVERHKLVEKEVALPDVTQVMKEEKRGPILGVAHRLRMYWEILRSILF